MSHAESDMRRSRPRKSRSTIRSNVSTDRGRKVREAYASIDPKKKAEINAKKAAASRAYWTSVTKEQKKDLGSKISKAKKEKFASMSEEERASYKASRQEERRRYFDKMTPEQKDHLNQQMQDMSKQYWQNITPEEKERRAKEMSARSLKMWEERSLEERDRIISKLREGYDVWYESMTDEEREEIRNRLWLEAVGFWSTVSDERKDQIIATRNATVAAKSDEEKAAIGKKISDALRRRTDEEWAEHGQRNRDRYNALSAEEKEAYGQYRKEWYANTSDEYKMLVAERSRRRWAEMSPEERLRQGQLARDQYNAMSDEEKAQWAESSRQHAVKRWEDMSEEDREKYTKILYDISHGFWDNISKEQVDEILCRAHRKASQNNGLHEKFKKRISDYLMKTDLIQQFEVFDEIVSTNNGVSHCWDFVILNRMTNEIAMVIDLDGAYYHADNCDYDGIHNHEDRDEIRSLSVPDGVIYLIIYELDFDRSFNNLKRLLSKSYDNFMDDIFKHCRNMPFPTPTYTARELIRSYEKLQRVNYSDEDTSLNTRLGDRLIQHFHPSIWSARRKGKPSPHEAWYDDELLKKCIRNRTIYQNHLNPNKILQGFNVSKIAPKVSVFSAGRAKMIISRYLSEFDVIFDPFSGFSGRMLGAVSLGKDYIGDDISEIHVRESNNMIGFLRDHGVHLNTEVLQQDITTSYGSFPCLFTCPPYSDKEQWLEVPVDKRSCDDWIDLCLDHFKCKRYVFVVDETIKYKDYIVDVIKNRSHFSSGSEYIIVIDR